MALVPYADASEDDAGPRPGPNNYRSTESPEVTWSEMTEGGCRKASAVGAPALAGAAWAVTSSSPGPFPAL